MSDDLISRKAFMEYLGLEDTEENREENVGEIVTLEDFDKQATAFDKEKVKIQIKNKAGIGMCQEKKCKKYNNDCDECRVETAIEIVEKGGVE